MLLKNLVKNISKMVTRVQLEKKEIQFRKMFIRKLFIVAMKGESYCMTHAFQSGFHGHPGYIGGQHITV